MGGPIETASPDPGKSRALPPDLKKWLKNQPESSTIPELQPGIDRFVTYYNETRSHTARGCPTLQAWRAFDKATPELDGQLILAATNVRHDIIDKIGAVTLRYRSRLLHIGVGRAHRGRRVLILIADLDVRIVDEDGVMLHFVLDPSVDCQAQSRDIV